MTNHPEEQMTETYDIQDIMNVLPHRYPFLLVDRIIELIPGKEATALKNVTINEPFFQGHFPGRPIMPGVLIIEAMGQAGGVLANASLPAEERGALIYFMGMDKVRFRKPVVPGDQILFRIQVTRRRKNTFKMAGAATVNAARVAEAELMAVFGEKP